jgi:hypothetical protein
LSPPLSFSKDSPQPDTVEEKAGDKEFKSAISRSKVNDDLLFCLLLLVSSRTHQSQIVLRRRQERRKTILLLLLDRFSSGNKNSAPFTTEPN